MKRAVGKVRHGLHEGPEVLTGPGQPNEICVVPLNVPLAPTVAPETALGRANTTRRVARTIAFIAPGTVQAGHSHYDRGMATNRPLAGSCECGAVRYEVADAFLYAANCHCSRCRAATGTAFKSFAGIEREKLTVTAGADKLLIFGEEDGNHTRCAVCGSLLYSVVRDGDYVHVAMGSLVDAPSLRPTEHIHVASKAPWFEITDALPQHDELD